MMKTPPPGVRLRWMDEAALEQDAPPRPRNALERVAEALPADGGTRTLQELAAAAGLSYGSTANALTQLRAAGRAENPERGRWRRGASPSPSSPPGSVTTMKTREPAPAAGSVGPDGRARPAPADFPPRCAVCRREALRTRADGTMLCEQHWPKGGR
jgi:hypothetical protein